MNDLTIIEKPVDHPVAVYLASLSQGSQQTAMSSLSAVSLYLGYADMYTTPWHLLRFQHMQAMRQWLIETYAPTTGRKIASFVKGVLKTCRRLGLMSADEYTSATDIPAIKGDMPKVGRMVSSDELTRLLEVCAYDPLPAGYRDAAIIAFLAATGVRRGELASLPLSSYDKEKQTVTISRTKSKRSRQVPVLGNMQRLLDEWISQRAGVGVNLFLSVTGHGKITPRGITPNTVLDILTRRALQAGIPRFTPHDLRRTIISNLLEQGVDLGTIKALSGHQNIETLLLYDRRGHAALQKAVAEHVVIPYIERNHD